MSKRYLPWLVLLLIMPAFACTLLDPPQRPDIPTPVPTLPSLRNDSGELVINPVNSVLPAVDNSVVDLMEQVSQQQLLAYVTNLSRFNTRHTLSETELADQGIGAARRWIHDEFLRVGGGRLQVSYQDFSLPYLGLTTQQRNIVAVLPGTDPYPGVVVLSAHYDSRADDVTDGRGFAPGANDNASGVALLLEVARLLSSRSWNHTIMFVAFAAEEQGTHGSKFFVREGMLGGAIYDANLNSDIVGGRAGIPQSIRVFSLPDEFSNSRQLARYMEYIGGLYLPTFPVALEGALDRPDRYSDHREFINAGSAAVRITESVEEPAFQHNGLDTAEKLDYNYLRQVTQLNLAVAANMIGAPPPPPQPLVTKMAEPGSFLVTWNPQPGVAGYAISFRPLGAATYEPFHIVPANDAGNVVLTGLNAAIPYAVSLAAIDISGRIGRLSPEMIVDVGP